MNFQLPQPEEEFDYYANSSQDDSRGGQADRSNGLMSKKRRRRNVYSSDDGHDGSYSRYVSEERYRAILGEHVHKYKRRNNNNNDFTSPAPSFNGTSYIKSSRKGSKKIEIASNFLPDIITQKLDNYREADFSPHFDMERSFSEAFYLDIGDGISYRIPPTYEMLATSLNLPRMSEIQVDELYLKGTLDLGSLASMMAANKRFGLRNRVGMGDPKSQYQSLQARLKTQKFNLKLSDIALDLYSIPEGAAGGIRCSIMSDSGTLQVYYVKVLEKGGTYEEFIQMGILPGHVPTIAELKPGLLSVHEGNDVKKYFISSGFAFVHSNSYADILAVEAIPIDRIDPAQVQKGLSEFTQKVGSATSELDKAEAQIGVDVHSALNSALTECYW